MFLSKLFMTRPERITSLVDEMKRSNTFVELSKVRRLAAYGVDAVVAIIGQYKNGGRDERVTLCSLLTHVVDRLGDRCVATLLCYAQDADDEIRAFATSVLGLLRNVTITKRILELLDDKSPKVRAAACISVSLLKDPSLTVFLIDKLKSIEPEVRKAAVIALHDVPSADAVDELINLLKDKDCNIRICAAEALGEIGSNKATASLIELLSDSCDPVILAAVGALAEIQDPEAVKHIEPFLSSRHPEIASAARRACFASAGTGQTLYPYVRGDEGVCV